jgi:hypothetical protein
MRRVKRNERLLQNPGLKDFFIVEAEAYHTED